MELEVFNCDCCDKITFGLRMPTSECQVSRQEIYVEFASREHLESLMEQCSRVLLYGTKAAEVE